MSKYTVLTILNIYYQMLSFLIKKIFQIRKLCVLKETHVPLFSNLLVFNDYY